MDVNQFLNGLPGSAYDTHQRDFLIKCALKGIDYSPLLKVTSDMKLSYNIGHMYALEYGISAGLDIRECSKLDDNGKPVYNPDQMKEILDCVKDGVPLSLITRTDVYGFPVYSDMMMYLIHSGYMYGLDTEMYAKVNPDDGTPVFCDKAASEIYLGLKAGFDVSSYAALDESGHPIYSPDKMANIRKELERNMQDEYSFINTAV